MDPGGPFRPDQPFVLDMQALNDWPSLFRVPGRHLIYREWVNILLISILS